MSNNHASARPAQRKSADKPSSKKNVRTSARGAGSSRPTPEKIVGALPVPRATYTL